MSDQKEYFVKCKQPENDYPIPEFLAALDNLFCQYSHWSTCEGEEQLVDALDMYAKHKREES